MPLLNGVALSVFVLLLAACGGNSGSGPQEAWNPLPTGVSLMAGPTIYDGSSDDLLTAGLGKSGLAGAAPGFADAANPTPAELRRRAIYTNYRAVLDISAAGGYGTLYGPNVAIDGSVTPSEGKIVGKEYLAYADDGTGRKNVVLLVQIPASFDKTQPCIIAGPSSGSRGVYGAIGSAGEWGLKHGCAVAYTDAGKGIGYHDLAADKVNLMDGRLVERSSAGTLAHFAVDLSSAALVAFNSLTPNRIAYKHIHSQQNPEKDWGKNVLDSLRFAFWALNQEYATVSVLTGEKSRSITPANTTVIASSISNGGAESLQAAEQDSEGLIDGVAVAEPNAQPASSTALTVRFGGAVVANAGKPLVDYFTYRMLYEPCAAISALAQAANGTRPGWFGFGTAPLGSAVTQVAGVELQTIATNRCQSLADKGLVAGATTAQQADSALVHMRAYGWTDANQDALHASHYRMADVYVAYGYVSAYGKFSVTDNVCGFSLANVDVSGKVAEQAATKTLLFATSNGLNSGADVVYNESVGGAVLYHLGVSPSTGRMDGALDGLLCLRSLVTGANPVSGQALTGPALANSARVQSGLQDVLLSGKLRAVPTLIMAGRSDTLVPVNHAARAYAALNAQVEGASSQLRYFEIMSGQHFDAFISNAAAGGVQGYDTLFVPVHVYFIRCLDMLWAHLKKGTPLAPSQVVRTLPRGGTPGLAPAITAANVPAIAAVPALADVIAINAGSISVPN